MRHWARIIKQWPIDRVRPAHVSFQTIMQTRLQKASSPSAAAEQVKANDALVTPAKAPQVQEQDETRQLNALYSLLDDRFMRQYPLPANLRHPQSNPEHYDRIMQELDEAPNRSWLSNLMLRLKGSVRMR